jgi:hypothetical protein
MVNHLTLAKIRENQIDATRNNQLQEFWDTADRYIALIIDFLFRLSGKETEIEKVLLKAAIVSLVASVVNQLEAARLSLRAGLLQPATVLFRSAYETTLLVDYLAIHPQEALRWAQGKEIRMAAVRKGLPDLASSSSEVYRIMSEMAHPNLASVYSLLFNIEGENGSDKGALGILVGGQPSDNQVLAWGQAYITICLFTTTIFLLDAAPQIEPQSSWEDLVERKSELDKWTINKWPHLRKKLEPH